MEILRRAKWVPAKRAAQYACAAALFLSALTLLSGWPASSESQGADVKQGAQLTIPRSIKAEHEELHAGLAAAVRAGGKVGAAAREVEELLHQHFAKEEEYALPPLGLLPALAEGTEPRAASDAVLMADRLKASLPQMLREHKAVGAALERLDRAARDENKPEHSRFATELMLHARSEEEVLYPAAVLVGEYLKLKLKK